MDGNTLRLGGLAFDVEVAGPLSGVPVLLLHGFPETHHMWARSMKALAQAGYRAIAPDQRGYSPGARPEGFEPYATAHLIADALGVMDTLGAQKFHVVGHDWGGQIAWLLATSSPERVESLFVLSRPHPAAFARAIQEDSAQAERSRHHSAFLEEGAAQRMREAGLEPLRIAMRGAGVPDVEIEIYTRAMLHPGAIESAMNWYRANTIADPTIPPLDLPTTYVWGTEDATVGRRAAELTREFVRGPYSFEAVGGASHFLVDQDPDKITALLLAHLAKYA
jgi:pimeloyl-ACP methyl ester carboxylesterase